MRDINLLSVYLTGMEVCTSDCFWSHANYDERSAFAGLAVMLIFFPLPGIIARAMQGLQRRLMVKTDARVQTVTESVYLISFLLMVVTYLPSVMGVLRMVKMFGWEKQISNRVADKRDDELQIFKARELLGLLNQIVKFVTF